MFDTKLLLNNFTDLLCNFVYISGTSDHTNP